jgi:gamma-glutamylcyclotransferase
MRLYFAYGSNLWRQQMQARCPEHRFLGAGILPGYRIIITTNGYANVVKSPSDLVFGSVYAISGTDEDRLDLCEGVRDGLYRKETIEVHTERGLVSCLVYVDPVEEEGAPRDEYVERIKRGIADAKLPPLYVDTYLWQMAAN